MTIGFVCGLVLQSKLMLACKGVLFIYCDKVVDGYVGDVCMQTMYVNWRMNENQS